MSRERTWTSITKFRRRKQMIGKKPQCEGMLFLRTGVQTVNRSNTHLFFCWHCFCFVPGDRVLLCSPGWPWIHNLSALAFWVLGLQAWITTPCIYLLLKAGWYCISSKSNKAIHRQKLKNLAKIKKIPGVVSLLNYFWDKELGKQYTIFHKQKKKSPSKL
jgi:hypothetical protein